MKQMLDKDFDQVFKSAFEGFELEPANNSWDKIAETLKSKPKKKNKQTLWMAAASFVIVAGFGISLFNKPVEVIKLRKHVVEELAQESPSETTFQEEFDTKNSSKQFAAAKPQKNYPAKKLESENHLPNAEDVKGDELKLDATTEAFVAEVKPLRAKSVTELLLQQEEQDKIAKVYTENNISVSENTAATTIANDKKVKINTVGDLVNFVIAKVDKREDKLIKMSQTAESDNEITEINLGLFKFKKQ
ncbi:hypothetical protein [Pelobium manganitolerans]|uniref:hypothetical protein n=1 Tax=Pelobium manganitolerans TaxID=1842495 RepID=UPI003FA3C233